MATEKKAILYYDCTALSGCTAFFSREYSLLPAGTTVYSMPPSCYDDGYRQIEERNGLFFFFEKNLPCPSFYGVPQIDLFAKDQMGRLYGTIGGITDLEEKQPVCRIHPDGTIFRAADSLAALLEASAHPRWDDSLPKETAVTLFSSLEEARKALPFWDPPAGSWPPGESTP